MAENRTKPAVVAPKAAPAAPVKKARGARMAVLIGPEQGAPNFITRRFLLAPGARIEWEAQDNRLAFALEAGRVYGLRQQYYDMRLQRGLNREAKQNHTEAAY